MGGDDQVFDDDKGMNGLRLHGTNEADVICGRLQTSPDVSHPPTP